MTDDETSQDAASENLDAAGDNTVDAARLLLSAEEAATLLNVNRSTVYDMLGRGKLASVKIGRRRLVPATELRDFITANLHHGHQ